MKLELVLKQEINHHKELLEIFKDDMELSVNSAYTVYTLARILDSIQDKTPQVNMITDLDF